MKTSRLFLAIIAMAIVATAVAVVSCKKDTENALNKEYNTVTPSEKHFNNANYYYHQLHIDYGQLVSNNPSEPGQD